MYYSIVMTDLPDDIDIENETTQIEEEEDTESYVHADGTMVCPNCGEATQDQVIFWCNKCSSKELIQKDGIQVCPQCLDTPSNIECRTCHSKDVHFK